MSANNDDYTFGFECALLPHPTAHSVVRVRGKVELGKGSNGPFLLQNTWRSHANSTQVHLITTPKEEDAKTNRSIVVWEREKRSRIFFDARRFFDAALVKKFLLLLLLGQAGRKHSHSFSDREGNLVTTKERGERHLVHCRGEVS